MSGSPRVSRFRNPSNGYEENVGQPWLWCLLLGPIYFAAKGIWFHAATALLLAIVTGGIAWLIYPFFANWSVRKHYLRNGWVPQQEEQLVKKPPRGAGATQVLWGLFIIAGASTGYLLGKDAPDTAAQTRISRGYEN